MKAQAVLALGLYYTEDPGILLSSLWIAILTQVLPLHPRGGLQKPQQAVRDTCTPTWPPHPWASEHPGFSQTSSLFSLFLTRLLPTAI